MERKPKISIIVPLFNAEKYIDRCMSAIYAQTLTDYEIILVDDGSADASAEICRKYAKHDDRITFITKENGGAGSARNMGIEIASGDYLAFPDVDDWFEPEMYQELYLAAVDKNYDVVFSGVNYYKQINNELVYDRTDTGVKASFHNVQECRSNIMLFFPTTTIFDVPWNKLYKREIVIDHQIRFSDTRRCQDAMFNIDFFNAISSVVSVDRAFYNYITNDIESIYRKFPRNYIDINIAYYTKLINILKSWNMYCGDIKMHYDTSIVLAVYDTLGMLGNPIWNFSRNEKKNYVNDILSRNDLYALLSGADIRDDAKKEANIILNRKRSAFMRAYYMKQIKSKIRASKSLMSLYQKLRHQA